MSVFYSNVFYCTALSIRHFYVHIRMVQAEGLLLHTAHCQYNSAYVRLDCTAQLHNCTTAQMHTCTTAQLKNCTTAQLNNCTPAEVNNCTTVQLHTCTTAQMQKCTKEQLHNWTTKQLHNCTFSTCPVPGSARRASVSVAPPTQT